MTNQLIKNLDKEAHQYCSIIGKYEQWAYQTKFAQLVAEQCAAICEDLATKVAGCRDGNLTAFGDDCAKYIRKDFGL